MAKTQFSIVDAELYLVVLPDHYGKHLPKYEQCGLDELMYRHLITPAIWSKMSDISKLDVEGIMPEVFVFDYIKGEMVKVMVRIIDLAEHGVKVSDDGYSPFNAIISLPGEEYSDSYRVGYFVAKA
jgi:hypothetical protein